MSLPASLLPVDRSLARQLFRIKHDGELRKTLQQWLAESDQVVVVPQWRTIQQVLQDHALQSKRSEDSPASPLDHCLSGGRQLYQGTELCVSLTRPDMIPHLAQQLDDISDDRFRELSDASQEPEQLDAAFDQFQVMRRFYHQCAERGDSAVFVAELE